MGRERQMTITLYKIKDDRRAVDKTLNNTTKVTELTAHIKSDCDILHPVLKWLIILR